jgi:hypothetical protein
METGTSYRLGVPPGVGLGAGLGAGEGAGDGDGMDGGFGVLGVLSIAIRSFLYQVCRYWPINSRAAFLAFIAACLA